MKIKKFLIVGVLFSFLCFNGLSLMTKADSGWDSSYDGGGSSWDSGSSWSDSSWSSSDYGSSGGSISSPIVVIIIFIVIIVIACKQKGGNSTNISHNNSYVDMPDEVLNKYGIDKETFKTMVFEKYVEIQNAWSNFDYKKLRKDLTDELANTYIMQLDALKIKNQKNVMNDFKYIDAKIISVNEVNGLLNINVYLRVEMYDYVVDKDFKVLRGSDKHKIDIEYVITFVKTSDKEVKDTICPNCGAKIELTTGGKCDYCGSVVVVNAKDYVVSKKTCVGQRSK